MYHESGFAILLVSLLFIAITAGCVVKDSAEVTASPRPATATVTPGTGTPAATPVTQDNQLPTATVTVEPTAELPTATPTPQDTPLPTATATVTPTPKSPTSTPTAQKVATPTASPTLEDTPAADPLGAFETQLQTMLMVRDFTKVQDVLPESFVFGFWRSEGYNRNTDEAIEELQRTFFKVSNPIEFTVPPDLSADLPDGDILKIWNPEVNPVSALFVTGCGDDGAGEAFLIIAEPEPGVYQWVGLVFASAGFVLPATP